MEDSSVLGTTFGTPSQSDLNDIAVQHKLLQLEYSTTSYELPSVLGSTFSSPNITANLSYSFSDDKSVLPEQNSDVSIVSFKKPFQPKIYAGRESSFEKAFEDSQVNNTNDSILNDSVPVKKSKKNKPRFRLRNNKRPSTREEDFQDAFASSLDESGISKKRKPHFRSRNNERPSIHVEDFQAAFTSSVDESTINEYNKGSSGSKNNSRSNAGERDFQTTLSSSLDESGISKNSKCNESNNSSRLTIMEEDLEVTFATSVDESGINKNSKFNESKNNSRLNAREEDFQTILSSSLDESGISKNSKFNESNNSSRLNVMEEDLEVTFATSVDDSGITKNSKCNESKNSSRPNIQEEDFQADFDSSLDDSRISKNSKLRFKLRNNKRSSVHVEDFQHAFVSSSDESGISENMKTCFRVKNNNIPGVLEEDFLAAFVSSVDESGISKNNESNRGLKNTSRPNVREVDFQTDCASLVNESGISKNSKCRGSKNSSIILNAREGHFQPTLVEPKVGSKNLKGYKTNLTLESVLHKTNSINEEEGKVIKITSTSKVKNISGGFETDYQSNSLCNQSLKTTTLITNNNSQTQSETKHGNNNGKASLQSHMTKTSTQLELNSTEFCLDKINLTSKPSFKTASNSLDRTSINNIDEEEDKVSEIVSLSKFDNTTTDSEDDYQTNHKNEEKENTFEIVSVSKLDNTLEHSKDDYQSNSKNVEEKTSEKISTSKLHNASENFGNYYQTNSGSNKSLKFATLIVDNNSETQTETDHDGNKRKVSFQLNLTKSIPQIRLNSVKHSVDKTNSTSKPSFEAACISLDCSSMSNMDEEEDKVSEIISISNLNHSSENDEGDYQTNSEEEEEEKVSKIISISNLNHSSENDEGDYQTNSEEEGENVPEDEYQTNGQNEKVSKIISISNLNNSSEDYEGDYKKNSEEEGENVPEDEYQTNGQNEKVSEIISMSKLNNSSENSNKDYQTNNGSNKTLKSPTLITGNNFQSQSGVSHDSNKRKVNLQLNVNKTIPQLALNSTYNILSPRRDLEQALNLDILPQLINSSKNQSQRLNKYSAFHNLGTLTSPPPNILSDEMSNLTYNSPVVPEMTPFTNGANNSLPSVQSFCKRNVDIIQSVTSLDKFPDRHSEETLHFIKTIRKGDSDSQRPLKPLNHTKVNSFVQKCPFSELRPKQSEKLTVSNNKDVSSEFLIKDNIQKAAKSLKSILKSKQLSRPKRWVTKRLYRFLFKKLLPNYGIRYRLEAQKLIMFMVEKVTDAVNRSLDYDVPVEELKIELAQKKIVETNRDFFNFVREFLERDFYLKAVPNSRPTLKKQIIRFTPGTIDDKILQS